MDLTGQMLIAMPGMTDPRFARSLICLVSSNEEGAMGLIVNKPLPADKTRRVLEQLPVSDTPTVLPVHYGGPVEQERGFVLHSGDYPSRLQTVDIVPGVEMSATIDSLEDVASVTGPSQARLLIGYAGWGAGQLEGEIAQNAWLSCPTKPELVFCEDAEGAWAAALGTIGVDPRTLSAVAGRA